MASTTSPSRRWARTVRSDRGATSLTELTTVLAVAGVLLGAILLVAQIANAGVGKTERRTDSLTAAKRAIASVTRDVREAYSVTVTAPPASGVGYDLQVQRRVSYAINQTATAKAVVSIRYACQTKTGAGGVSVRSCDRQSTSPTNPTFVTTDTDLVQTQAGFGTTFAAFGSPSAYRPAGVQITVAQPVAGVAPVTLLSSVLPRTCEIADPDASKGYEPANCTPST